MSASHHLLIIIFLLNQLQRGKWTVCFYWSTRNKVQTSLTVRTRRDSEWNLVCFLQTCHVKRLQSFFLMKKWNRCTFFPIGVLFFCASKSILLYFLHLLVVSFLVRKSKISISKLCFCCKANFRPQSLNTRTNLMTV